MARDWPRTYKGREFAREYEPGLVSVIVPVYNRLHMLGDALGSVAAQTYRPVELVVVDDGSWQDVGTMVNEWAAEHQEPGRFTVRFVRQENAGISGARNLGMVECHGEYIQFLDSDDYLHPERLETMVGRAREVEDVQLVMARGTVVDEEGAELRGVGHPNIRAADRFRSFIWGALGPWIPLYHRDFLREVGLWRVELKTGEEWEQGLRVAAALDPDRCAVLEESLIYWRHHSGERQTDARWNRKDLVSLREMLDALDKVGSLEPHHYDECALKLAVRPLRAAASPLEYDRIALRAARSGRMKLRIWALLGAGWLIGTVPALEIYLRLFQKRLYRRIVGPNGELRARRERATRR